LKILVTGGAGFIASHIVDAYVKLGHDVSVLDNLSTGKKGNLNPAATFHQMDIRDNSAVGELLRREKFDVVNHHAAQIDVRRSVDDPAFDASVNVIGAITILEHCVKTGVMKFIFASSGGAIYGEQDYFPADEQHPTRPISPYGIAKLTTELYLFYYKTVHQLHSVSLRYANVYGPRQNPEGEAGVVSIFTTRMLEGKEPIINGDGKQTRDYVYVGDVARANVLALQHEGSAVFNVGTGVETDVNQLFQMLKEHARSSAPEKHGPAKKGEQTRSVLSAALFSTSMGWTPTVSLSEGLKSTVEYFTSRSQHGS
jgi:UDP-glucose 4-epimerase